MSIIRTKIQLSGKGFDPQAISSALSIQPSKTKTISEYPSQTILSGRAVDLWQWDTERTKRTAISDELNMVQQLWMDKVQQVRSLCTQYNICCHITIVIELTDGSDLPELVLTVSNLHFLNSIKAEFALDVY